jgi:hypothetical protein
MLSHVVLFHVWIVSVHVFIIVFSVSCSFDFFRIDVPTENMNKTIEKINRYKIVLSLFAIEKNHILFQKLFLLL